MTIPLSPEMEAALKQRAQEKGITLEELIDKILREKLCARTPPIEPQDEWERLVLSAASDCGVSPPNSAFSREELYDL